MSSSRRDPYPDALRAGALVVVVFGHWMATLPRLVDGRLVDTDHLLAAWDAAGMLTWLVQVVPLFVFVSAAVGKTASWWRRTGVVRPANVSPTTAMPAMTANTVPATARLDQRRGGSAGCTGSTPDAAAGNEGWPSPSSGGR